MNKTIIIGTTAINRPILHNDVIPDWLQWICKLKDEYIIKWFINIDIIDKLDATFEQTKDNFLNIIKDHKRIDVTFLQNETGEGNFLYACKRISENINNYYDLLPDDHKKSAKIIWLEDDWKFNNSTTCDINKIIELYSTNMSHINLTFIRNNYIWALAPSIMSFELWHKLHYSGWKSQVNMIDPEHCIGLYYLKHFGKESDVNNLTVFARKIENGKLKHSYTEYVNSKYTYYDDKFNSGENERYIKNEDIKKTYDDTIVFIRITPNFSVGGCNYGRNFMEKHGLYKSNIQNNSNTNFYKKTQ